MTKNDVRWGHAIALVSFTGLLVATVADSASGVYDWLTIAFSIVGIIATSVVIVRGK
ncbi:MAG: hypothetical protein M3O70_22110 [Actinomycetota bacterium]|nr:hypothetical protein [Actinomycetota bacterium]